jgi:hypothetical protein
MRSVVPVLEAGVKVGVDIGVVVGTAGCAICVGVAVARRLVGMGVIVFVGDGDAVAVGVTTVVGDTVIVGVAMLVAVSSGSMGLSKAEDVLVTPGVIVGT